MASVFYLTTMMEDEDEGEILSERYVVAVHKNDAIAQGRRLFGASVDFGCLEILEGEWNTDIALQCIQDTIDNFGSDALMLFALKQYPDLIDAELVSEILCDDYPQSFKFALDHILLKDCKTVWIELTVEYQDKKSLQLLLNKGLRDNGVGLAQACDCGNHILFEILYPYSNPYKALKQTDCENLHWIEERLAAEQKQRLEQHVTPPLRTSQRKM